MVALISNGGLTSALEAHVLQGCKDQRVACPTHTLIKVNHPNTAIIIIVKNKYTTINKKEFTVLMNIMSSYYLTFILRLLIHSHGNQS